MRSPSAWRTVTWSVPATAPAKHDLAVGRRRPRGAGGDAVVDAPVAGLPALGGQVEPVDDRPVDGGSVGDDGQLVGAGTRRRGEHRGEQGEDDEDSGDDDRTAGHGPSPGRDSDSGGRRCADTAERAETG